PDLRRLGNDFTGVSEIALIRGYTSNQEKYEPDFELVSEIPRQRERSLRLLATHRQITLAVVNRRKVAERPDTNFVVAGFSRNGQRLFEKGLGRRPPGQLLLADVAPEMGVGGEEASLQPAEILENEGFHCTVARALRQAESLFPEVTRLLAGSCRVRFATDDARCACRERQSVRKAGV